MFSDLRELALDAVNDERAVDQLVLYTPANGSTTRTNVYGTEIVARVIEPPPPVTLRQTAVVELVERREGMGDTSIPADGLVLSGHGVAAEALRSLWSRIETGDVGRRALLRLETTPALRQSVGGTPIVLRDGRRWVEDNGSPFVGGRHPRSLVGWNRSGDVFLVAVDGRQPDHSVGMSLPEAADLLAGLGATEAINLDGGGSTTLVAAGEIANRPSDRLVESHGRQRIVAGPAPVNVTVGAVERPVASALAVVPRAATPHATVPAGEPLTESLQLPRPLPLAVPADVASRPDGGVPALVALTPRPEAITTPLLALAVLVNAVAAGAFGASVLRSRLGADVEGGRTSPP